MVWEEPLLRNKVQNMVKEIFRESEGNLPTTASRLQGT